LVKGNDIRLRLPHTEQEILVTHFGEPDLLLLLRHSFHVVNFGLLNPDDVLLCLRRQRRPREELRPFAWRALPAATGRVRDQSFVSESFLVEEISEPKTAIRVSVCILLL